MSDNSRQSALSDALIARRDLLKKLVLGVTGASLSSSALATLPDDIAGLKLKGNINHSVARWTYRELSVEELCIVTKTRK